MTLHEKATQGLLKGEFLTSELLNKKNDFGNTVWICATEKSLQDIPEHLFTNEVLTQKDRFGITLLQIIASCNTLHLVPQHLLTADNVSAVFHTAAKHKSLKHIPKHLFTEEVLSKQNDYGETVWHLAAQHGTLKDIPKHLLTNKALSLENKDGNTVWHYVVRYHGFKHIPVHLFTKEAFTRTNQRGVSPLTYISKGYHNISDLPKHIIDEYLLEIKDRDGKSLFNETDKAYIQNVVETRLVQFNNFIASNPELEQAIVHRDPRLVYFLANVQNDSLNFMFSGVEDEIILSKKGVFLNNENHETLANVVSFIEDTYNDVEKSIVLPINKSQVISDFTL